MSESTIQEMSWQEALAANNGDYAYHNRGGMISREEIDSYTVHSGTLAVGSVGISYSKIPAALAELNMSADGWSYE